MFYVHTSNLAFSGECGFDGRWVVEPSCDTSHVIFPRFTLSKTTIDPGLPTIHVSGNHSFSGATVDGRNHAPADM